jgi:hypothetical protein
MKREAYAQLTVRKVPRRVAERLKTMARRDGKSMNELTLELLQRGLGLEDEPAENHDLDEFIGSWKDDPAFDEVVESMRKVDPELWK